MWKRPFCSSCCETTLQWKLKQPSMSYKTSLERGQEEKNRADASLGSRRETLERQNGSLQLLLLQPGSAPAPAESSPGPEAVFQASVGATEVSGETACSLGMGCLDEILSTSKRGQNCGCCCSCRPIPPSPLPSLQAQSQAEQSQL